MNAYVVIEPPAAGFPNPTFMAVTVDEMRELRAEIQRSRDALKAAVELKLKAQNEVDSLHVEVDKLSGQVASLQLQLHAERDARQDSHPSKLAKSVIDHFTRGFTNLQRDGMIPPNLSTRLMTLLQEAHKLI